MNGDIVKQIGKITLLIVIISLIILTIFTSRTKRIIPPDSQSVKRTTQLNRVMTSSLGNKWPIILLLFGLVICVCLVSLYYATTKENLNISFSESQSKSIRKLLIITLIAFSLVIIVVAIQTYISGMPTRWIKGSVPYQEEEDLKKQRILTVGIIGSIMILITVLYGIYWIVFQKFSLNA